jgi:hypothetical protein
MTAPEINGDVRSNRAEVVVDLRARRGTSRYTRQSGALPRLSDDPTYVPMSGGLPHPVSEPRSFLERLRERLSGR